MPPTHSGCRAESNRPLVSTRNLCLRFHRGLVTSIAQRDDNRVFVFMTRILFIVPFIDGSHQSLE